MLDGMRGLAALAVLLRHVEFAAGLSKKGAPLLPHAYLAVDFFYVLSGFVIALAYERKLMSSLPIGKFLLRRVIRLYPMAFVGACLGALSLGMHLLVSSDFSVGQVLSASLSGFLVLPSDALMPLNDQKFPANVPEWSLFFECLVNVAYAVIVRWLTTLRLLGICLLAAGALSISAVYTRDLDGGWSHSTFWLGFVRVGFGFFMGFYFTAFLREPASVGSRMHFWLGCFWQSCSLRFSGAVGCWTFARFCSAFRPSSGMALPATATEQ